MTITVYGTPQSRSIRAVWALEEAGASYDYELVQLRKGEGRRPPFVNINPGGKVPAVRWEHDGSVHTITESVAIINWVGELFPESGLYPDSLAQRAQYHRWITFGVAELEQPLWTISKHTFALPEKHRVSDVLDTARWEYEKVLQVLAAGIADRPWVSGDHFNGADIVIAHTLGWGHRLMPDCQGEALTDYMERVFRRPACERATAREAAA